MRVEPATVHDHCTVGQRLERARSASQETLQCSAGSPRGVLEERCCHLLPAHWWLCRVISFDHDHRAVHWLGLVLRWVSLPGYLACSQQFAPVASCSCVHQPVLVPGALQGGRKYIHKPTTIAYCALQGLLPWTCLPGCSTPGRS